jgi:ribosomal protein S27AE
MKEIFIDMMNEADDHLDYSRMRMESVSNTDILCPNCLQDKLIKESKEDASCVKCGYDFIIIDNTVRFK